MAGVKYIKKNADGEPASKTTAKADDKKPKANTKAKLASKSAANGKAATAANGTQTTVKPRGRPKRVATDGAKEPSTRKEPDTSRKRKAPEELKAEAKKAKVAPKGPVINSAPAQKLDVYVFGDGEQGELGLGAGKGSFHLGRARANPKLAANVAGVVQIAAGGMHAIALTHDNKILTWGVNDQGTLGRNTDWEGGLKDIDDNKSDESDESLEIELNPLESTPTAVPSDSFPEGTVFVQVAAGDSTSFALTDDGHVWGWGTFRSNEGIFGFSPGHETQRTPMLVPGLKNVKKLACGANHALALDHSGAVFAWGSGQQNQLGRRVIERTKIQGLIPREFGLPRRSIVDIACGEYHSFAVDKNGRVWAWGLNSYCETGIADNVTDDEAVILKPRVIDSLSDRRIVSIKGGAHHTVAVTEDGDCLTWGRVDGCQTGVDIKELNPEHVIKDERGQIRILQVPTKVTAIKEPVKMATAQSDHCMAVTRDGKVYGWGFAASKQLGLGDEDEHPIATRITSKAIADVKIDAAYAGGQFGIFTAVAGAQGKAKANGVVNGPGGDGDAEMKM